MVEGPMQKIHIQRSSGAGGDEYRCRIGDPELLGATQGLGARHAGSPLPGVLRRRRPLEH
jgi:hypothetical protein